MSTFTPDQQRKRFFAERERLTRKPGETWNQYRDRLWADSPEHKGGRCRCGTAYSLCVFAMYWRMQQPDWRKDGETHGGWGWAYQYLPPSHPDHQHRILVDGTCAWTECGKVAQAHPYWRG